MAGKPTDKFDSKIMLDHYKPFNVYEDPKNTTDYPEDKENISGSASTSSAVAVFVR